VETPNFRLLAFDFEALRLFHVDLFIEFSI
jgi:hypothetical protein